MMIKKVIKILDDFPINGEAYQVAEMENGKYTFAWGSKFPFEEDLPENDVLLGESGLSWHDTKKEALKAMEEAKEAWDV